MTRDLPVRRRGWLALALVPLLVVLAFYVADPQTGHEPTGNVESTKEIKRRARRVDFIKALKRPRRWNRNIDRGGAGEIDTRLRNVKIRELPVEDEEEEPAGPEQRENREIVAVMKRSLGAYRAAFGTFVCEGEMKMMYPTANSDPDRSPGERFGPAQEVRGRFVYKVDSRGNTYLHQETQTGQGNTEFDRRAYNGDLYFVDGEHVFTSGVEATRQTQAMDDILAAKRENGGEPLVRRNWISLLDDIEKIAGFQLVSEDSGRRVYEAEDTNPALQKSTVEMKRLSGRIVVDREEGVMLQGRLEGRGTLRRGYMEGGNIGFLIEMRVHSIGRVADIVAP